MITFEELKYLFHYDPETGDFIRLVTTNYNAKIGDLAGSFDKYGYRQINIRGKIYKAHRLAWLYMTGEWPNGIIDHKNMVRTDNRFSNLRVTNHSCNLANRDKNKNNTSGAKGVWWHKAANKWTASITVNRKSIYLGLFDSLEEASTKYNEAAKYYFGSFAKVTVFPC